MSDVERRLAALDPAAHETYHRDLDAMIARIVATPPQSAHSRWQRLQARVAGGVLVASVIVAASLATIQAAPSLPALSIQRALVHPSGTFATALAPASSATSVRVQAGSQLSSSAPSVHSYELATPQEPSGETARIAAVFGVAGAPRYEGASTWQEASPSGAVVGYVASGVPEWSYSSTSPDVAPATEAGHASVPVPSHASLDALAERYLTALGFNYALGTPSFSSATISTTTSTGAPLTVSSEQVTYVIDIKGIATDQTVSFTVDSKDNLLYATGPAFVVRRGRAYPLLSPLAGVEVLAAKIRPATNGSASSAVRATLTRADLALATYQLANGTLWLLPVYTYHGTFIRTSGAHAASTWRELAIKPSYVRGSTSLGE